MIASWDACFALILPKRQKGLRQGGSWRRNNSTVTKPRLEFEDLTKSYQLFVRSQPKCLFLFGHIRTIYLFGSISWNMIQPIPNHLILSLSYQIWFGQYWIIHPYYIIILSMSYYHLINNIRSISDVVIHILSSVFGLYWIVLSTLFGQTQYLVKLLLGSCWNELGIIWNPAFNAKNICVRDH